MATASTSTCRGSMRRSSSPSDGLFGGLFARGGAAAEVTDAAWLSAMLDVDSGRRRSVRDVVPGLKFGGAVVTLAALGDAGPAVAAEMARRLDLPDPPLPWHTVRLRPAELAGALGAAAGMVGKIALDVV